MVSDPLVFMEFIFGIRQAIRQMDRAPLNRCPPNTRGAVWSDRVFQEKLDISCFSVVGSRDVLLSCQQFEKAGIVCLAQSSRGLKNCIKNSP